MENNYSHTQYTRRAALRTRSQPRRHRTRTPGVLGSLLQRAVLTGGAEGVRQVEQHLERRQRGVQQRRAQCGVQARGAAPGAQHAAHGASRAAAAATQVHLVVLISLCHLYKIPL